MALVTVLLFRTRPFIESSYDNSKLQTESHRNQHDIYIMSRAIRQISWSCERFTIAIIHPILRKAPVETTENGPQQLAPDWPGQGSERSA